MQTDNPYDSALEVEAAAFALVGYGPYVTPTSYDFGAWVRRYRSKQVPDHPMLWEVTVEYSSSEVTTNAYAKSGGDPQQDPNVQPNPLLRPPIIHWSGAGYEMPMEIDANGRPLTNTAGFPYARRPNIHAKESVCTVTRNEASWYPDVMDGFRGTVNLNQFWHAAPGNAKMHDITAQSRFEGEVFAFWEITYEIHFRPYQDFSHAIAISPDGALLPTNTICGWEVPIRNVGRMQRVAGNPKPVYCMINKKPATTDCPLDRFGAQQEETATPVYTIFAGFKRKDWSSLNLG